MNNKDPNIIVIGEGCNTFRKFTKTRLPVWYAGQNIFRIFANNIDIEDIAMFINSLFIPDSAFDVLRIDKETTEIIYDGDLCLLEGDLIDIITMEKETQ